MENNINFKIYITNDLKYPIQAVDNNCSGVVQFEFIVTEKGCIDSISIISSPCASLTKETIRVLEKIACKWIAGTTNGKISTLKLKNEIVFKME